MYRAGLDSCHFFLMCLLGSWGAFPRPTCIELRFVTYVAHLQQVIDIFFMPPHCLCIVISCEITAFLFAE